MRARYGARLHGPAGTKWFPGTISATHDDGACDVAYDDGDFETQVPAACIKPAPVAPAAAVLTVKEEPAATELVATADVDRMDQHSGLPDGHTQPATATDPLTKSGAKIEVGPRVARAAVRVPVPVPTRTLPARERKAVVSYEAGPAPPPAQLALAARSLAHYRASQGAPTPEGQDSPTKTQSSVPANRAAAAAAGRDSDSDGGCGGSGGGELKKRPHRRSPAGKMWNGAIGEWENADEARAVVRAEEAQPEEAQAAHEAEGGGGRPLTETPLDRCLGAGQTPPFTLPDELPDGWVCRVHEKRNTTQYKRYEGPNGERAQSRRQVWVLHAESTGSVLLAGVAEAGPSHLPNEGARIARRPGRY